MSGWALGLFLVSAAVLLWTYAGYPLVLWVAARRWPDPVVRAPIDTQVAVVIVVRNEAAVIRQKLESCLAQRWPANRLKIVVVSDGSFDATEAIVTALDDPRIEWRPYADHRGKAARLCQVLSERTEPVVVLTDARQPLQPDAVAHLVQNFADPRVGAVSGVIGLRSDEGCSLSLGSYGRYESAIRRWEASLDSMVGVSGALYAIRREAFVPIPEHTVLDDVLIPMQIAAAGWRVVYEERALAWDRPAADLSVERQRKVRTLAGNFALLADQPWLLDPRRNRLWFPFLNHKVARLAGPPALLLALLASAWLAPSNPVFSVLFAGQIGLYGFVLIQGRSGRPATLPLLRWALTFVLLNWYVCLGFREWRSNPRIHAWRT